MNPDVLLGVLRACIPLVVGVATYFGFGNDAQDTIIASAVATAIVGVWSAYTNTQAAKIQAVNAANNGVKVVAVTADVPKVNTPIPALTDAVKKV